MKKIFLDKSSKMVSVLLQKGVEFDKPYIFTEGNVVKGQFTHFQIETKIVDDCQYIQLWFGDYNKRFNLFGGRLKWNEMRKEWKDEFASLIDSNKFELFNIK